MELTEEQKQEVKDRASAEAEIFKGEKVIGADEVDDNMAALFAKIDSLAEKVGTIESYGERIQQTEHRIGALTNVAANAKTQEDATLKRELEEQKAAKKIEADASWEEYQKEFPDMAKAVSGKLNEGLSEIESLKSKLESVPAGENLEVRLTTLLHPDWKTVVKSDDYKAWLGGQPKDIQTKAKFGQTADEAVYVLNKFKSKGGLTPGQLETSRRNRLESLSTDKRSKTTQSTRQKTEAEMSEEELRESVRREVFG